MKEFKKWNLKQSNNILQNNHRLYTYIDEERGRAWRAALEWVVKERRFYSRLNFDDKIEKELEE